MQTNNKLREALDDIIDKIDTWRSEGSMEHWQYSQLFDIADAALAAPVKNCEVGTPEEQAARMRAFCVKNGLCRDGSYRCENCGLLHEFRCELTWAQMPYEEGDGK